MRLCLDVDASLRVKIGPLAAHLGVRRSPVHTAADAGALAAAIAARPGVDVVGVMFYEAQVAGLPDSSAAVRAVKRLSIADLASRRAAVVAAVEDAVGHPLSLVNSGGSGSIASSAADPAVTEVTAGSGLFVPDAVRRLPLVHAPTGRVLRARRGAHPGRGLRDGVRWRVHRVRTGDEVPPAASGLARAACR